MSDTEKVYVISMRDGNRSFALQHVERVESMGIACIRGLGHYTKEYESFNGKVVYVPVAEIQSITEFESVRDYVQSMEAADRVRRKSKRSLWIFWGAIVLSYFAFLVWSALRHPK